MQGDDADAGDEGHYFFSAPASPVHYILRSPPSTTADGAASSPHAAPPADGDCCGDFEFGAAGHGGPEGAGAGVAMSSAEELFVAGRIRVGCLSPIRQGNATTEGPRHEDCISWAEEDERDARSPRARRARSASPPRSPRGGAEPSSDPFASAASSSSSSSSSSSAKSIRRRISLRDLLARTGGDCAGAEDGPAPSSGVEIAGRLGFWPPSIWPSRSSKKPPLPCPSPAPQPGRRSTSSAERAAKRAPGGGARRTTSLPYRQGLVLGCLGFGARGYGLARSMHPLSSR